MTVTVVVGAGLVPAALAPAAYAAGTVSATQEPETVVPAADRWYPQQETLLTAGAGGYLARSDAGTTRWVDASNGTPGAAVAQVFTGFNEGVNALQPQSAPGTVQLTDYASGAVSSITVPAGQIWADGFTSDTILTSGTGTGGLKLHVMRAANGGATSDTTVDGVPDGAVGTKLLAQSGRLAVVQLQVDGAKHTYLLDYDAASLREIFAGVPAGSVTAAVIGGTRVTGFAYDGTIVYSVRLDDPAATVEQTHFPDTVLDDAKRPEPVPVGDRILFVRAQSGTVSAGLPLLSVRVGGSATQTLLTNARWSYAIAPDGSVLVVGGNGSQDWAVRRITAAPGANPVLSTIVTLPSVPAQVHGLNVSGGQLTYSTDTRSVESLVGRDVPTGANPVIGDPSSLPDYGSWLMNCPSSTGTTLCAHLQGLGTGSTAFLTTDGVLEASAPPNGLAEVQLHSSGPSTIADGSGQYVVVNTPGARTQSVVDLSQVYEDKTIVLSRPITASAVWGSTLWVPGTTAGTVRPYDLRTRTFGTTVKTAGTCGTAFKELQADGRWLYWSCGTKAGVHDRQTGKDIPVPAGKAGDALLGDGYLVRHDAASGTLQLTDVHSGSAVTSTLANLPVTITADRNVLWSVDKYGGGVAYVDAQQRIHVLPLAGLPRSPLTLLTSQGCPTVDLFPLAPHYGSDCGMEWDMSRPAAGWTVTVRNGLGTTVLTRTGGAADRSGATVHVNWDMTTAPGRYVPPGDYTVTFTARPAAGQGPVYSRAERLNVIEGPFARDAESDGSGDLFALTADGRLDVRDGTDSRQLVQKASGAGWPASDTFVPFRDLDLDLSNDLLVRDSAGRLWFYSGHDDPAFTPSRPHTLIGSGYQQYNQLISAGDMNGDGIGDLLARDAAGRLWLHAGDGAGGLRPRTLVGSGYQQYNLITGGSRLFLLPWHGSGQIIARDSAGVLWRHDTDGKGHFLPRTRIGSGWNQYNSIVEVGSLRAWGDTDLVARDARGGLWLYEDDSNGHLTGPLWEGGGWQTYARLF
jgi:hypothetical protein